jgi:hypothetical protein
VSVSAKDVKVAGNGISILSPVATSTRFITPVVVTVAAEMAALIVAHFTVSVGRPAPKTNGPRPVVVKAAPPPVPLVAGPLTLARMAWAVRLMG